MRRSLLAAALALLMLAWPAEAQLFPAGSQQVPADPAPTERVILDATFWTFPVPVTDICITLPAGRVSATVQLVGDAPGQPVEFNFDGYKYNPDPGATIRLNVTKQPATAQIPIAGGRYCYAILNKAQVPPGVGTGSAGAIGYDQDVALKLTLAPAP